MAKNITATYTSGITLVGGDNPVSVSVTGKITLANGTALSGPGGGSTSWTIANAGTISAGQGNALALGSSATSVLTGVVTNQPGGTISGFPGCGVVIFRPGTVTNNSAIYGNTGGVSINTADGTVANAGAITAHGEASIWAPEGWSRTDPRPRYLRAHDTASKSTRAAR